MRNDPIKYFFIWPALFVVLAISIFPLIYSLTTSFMSFRLACDAADLFAVFDLVDPLSALVDGVDEPLSHARSSDVDFKPQDGRGDIAVSRTRLELGKSPPPH